MSKLLSSQALSWVRQSAAAGFVTSQVLDFLLQRVAALEKRPIPGTVEPPAPTSEADPPVMQRLMEAPMDARGYVDLRKPPAAQPAPPTAPAGGLVEMVAAAMHPNYPRAFRGEAHAAICEVAAWLDSVGNKGSANELRREADR